MLRIARIAFLLLALVTQFHSPIRAQQCCTGNVSTYCTAGTSVQGCVPAIAGVGIPSADAGAGFQVGVSGLPGQRYGTIFYGFYTYVTPWAPGSPSFKCVASPVQRTGTLSTGASAASCAGSLALDFNAWIAANPAALGSPFLPGQTIRAQAWYRDPSAPGQTNLSNALQFTLCSGVGDTTPPVITSCAANQTVGTTTSCQGIVPDFTASVVASDVCSPVSFTQSPAAGSVASQGNTTVTITARDVAGNTSNCVATLAVFDATGPVIVNCTSGLVVPSTGNCQGVVPNVTAGVVAIDGCGGPVSIIQDPPAGALTISGLTSTLITITAADISGNTSTCSVMLVISLSLACQGLVPIQPGTFQMGSAAPQGPPYWGPIGPVHMVTISQPFWIGSREVTQAEYAAVVGENPSNFQGDASRPVERVSWFDARAYCAALTAQQAAPGGLPFGYEYRLPTEAEWEYACRAGSGSEYNVGGGLDCTQARINFSHVTNSYCASGSTAPVGGYAPNAWGLFDMHGNVWEWCLDSYADYTASAAIDPFVTGGNERVVRGGGWGSDSLTCRSAMRGYPGPNVKSSDLGFRVVLGPILVP